ncbi:hypothetical protein ACFO5X_17535 [Seohaeicola nanhaiensis]|uniref:PEP-CTERM sorting domain-containing protein n=1 Tax=Seohaeicola nanhaiensis TaxID=1387282 RepID=A0ABV9KL48_9RHOB
MKRTMMAICAAVMTLSAGVAGAATYDPSAQTVLKGNDTSAVGRANFYSWVTSLDVYEAGFKIVKIARSFKNVKSSSDIVARINNKTMSGSWAWNGDGEATLVAFMSKGYFAAQYFAPGITNNTYASQELGLVDKNGDGTRIKHVSLYSVKGTLKPQAVEAKFAVEPEPEPVPLPAGGLLLVSGLGVLALRRRRG